MTTKHEIKVGDKFEDKFDTYEVTKVTPKTMTIQMVNGPAWMQRPITRRLPEGPGTPYIRIGKFQELHLKQEDEPTDLKQEIGKIRKAAQLADELVAALREIDPSLTLTDNMNPLWLKEVKEQVTITTKTATRIKTMLLRYGVLKISAPDQTQN